MSKKIKPYAIVPEELYVIRRADRQLKQIIEDMGRPGYVLVSRQMGKTNLLLNAKRYTDSADDCFTYLDVSNTFSDLRAFFRNIIDTIIFSRDELVTNLLGDLLHTRESTSNLQAHKEHEFELKRVLDNLRGKLVICLDEIDALTSVDYSDHVFSLIRSIYFGGRTQFPQFKRLTYVLSGVADPAELIKNKAISPFNIGEKIYLEDFTLSETQRFLLQCELALPDDVIERIYYWTCGNPRVTWDICSAAENARHDDVVLDRAGIDAIVNSLYLTNYDLPPFDHIRTRVQSDKELRNAVKAIHNGKTLNLSDKVKDRLYLAGISTPKLESGAVNFKNKIVEQSLSEKWISDIETSLLSLEDRAAEKIKLGRYHEALEILKEQVDLDEDPDVKLATRLNIGYCLMHLGDIPTAILEYENCQLEGVSRVQLINAKHHWTGVCYLFSERSSEAEIEFRSILDSGTPSRKINFYPEACINLASVLLTKLALEPDNASEISQEIEKLLVRAVDLVEQSPSTPAIQDDVILYTAYYQLSRHYGTDNAELAIAYLDKGLAVSEVDVKSTFLYERAQYEPDESKKIHLYQECARNIIDNELSLVAKDIEKLLKFGIPECSLLITKLVILKQTSDANALFQYVCSVQQKQGFESWTVIVGSVTELLKSEDLSSMPDLAQMSLHCTHRVSADFKQIVCLGLLLRTEQSPERDQQLHHAYMDIVLPDKSIPLEVLDFRVIHDIFFEFFTKNDTNSSLKLVELAEAAFERTLLEKHLTDETIFSGSLILLLLRIRLNIRLDLAEQLPTSLMPFIHNIWNSRNFSLYHFPGNFGVQLEKWFRLLIDQDFFNAAPEAVENVRELDHHIGQNVVVTVQYTNGRVRTAKFKKFKTDLSKGLCTIKSVG